MEEELRFELRPDLHRGARGRGGVVAHFGEVTVEVKRRKGIGPSSGSHWEVRLHGDRFPDVVYRTVGPAQATLRNSRLHVDGQAVGMKFNNKGLSSAARALHLEHEERSYTYRRTELSRGATLIRPGASITTTREKSTTGKGMSTFGVATGKYDATDLALVIAFDSIDTSELTTSGAVSGTVNRILFPRSNQPPAE